MNNNNKKCGNMNNNNKKCGNMNNNKCYYDTTHPDNGGCCQCEL